MKYKADHELARIENSNRLVKMPLKKKTIPYSLRIGGEWCRVINNNQQPMCNECPQMGHTRKRCQEIQLRSKPCCCESNLPNVDPDNAKNVNNTVKQWTLILTFKDVNDIFRTRIPISRQ